ncbi:hypothetical protein LIER_05620 [Lithospermum erythrorhizon]|uniref:AT-hook motif nuclear-localized protein n=1 Tax=Lithospermum erythrorhizon TaxID=34254 RepID=A0AAV3P2I8_LITER
MESSEGMKSSVTKMVPEASSNINVVPRTENSTPNEIQVAEAMPPVVSQMSMALIGSTEKKKRGRPRKYDGVSPSARTLSPMPLSASAPPACGDYFGEKSSVPRHVSSDKKQKQKIDREDLGDWISCSTGGSFLPHMITVNAGEDVSMKIISFSQLGPRAICVISAVGVISNVTLRQPNSSGGTLTYEGRFEILSLSGSFTPTEVGGSRNRTGGMSISLASPDGRVVGGVLAGLLIAATPVQVVVGSFLAGTYQEVKPKKQKPEAKLMGSHTTSYPAITYHSSNPEQQTNSTNPGLSNTAIGNPHLVSSLRPQTGMPASAISAMDDSRSTTDINISLHRD